MNEMHSVEHEFVHHIPPGDEMESGVVYVSIPFATAVHRCCCGCGNEVVTPLDPDQWKLTFDGKSISLSPSIGNWNFSCKSHYWIRCNQVTWARPWFEEDRKPAGKGHFSGSEWRSTMDVPNQPQKTRPSTVTCAQRIWRFLGGRFGRH